MNRKSERPRLRCPQPHSQSTLAQTSPAPAGPLGGELVALFDAASRAYDSGDWRETVQQCRDVRNHVEQHLREDPDQRVYRVVARMVNVDETDSRIKFLDSVWEGLANVTSYAHHVGNRCDAATAHAGRCC